MSLNNAEYICNIGPIQIYEIKEKSFFISNQPMYFWKYPDKLQAFGPFPSVIEAIRNWESTTVKTQLPSNVIRVDFRNKKRL